jgi:hypothetical protein
MEAIMRNLKIILGACLLISTAGCAYYDSGYAYDGGYYHRRPVYYGYSDRPYYRYYYCYGYRHYDYGFWQDRRADGHG